MTTLKNTAKPVTDLSFPAITICGSGLHMDRVGNKVAEKFVQWRTEKNRDNVTKEALEEDVKDYMHTIFQIKSSVSTTKPMTATGGGQAKVQGPRANKSTGIMSARRLEEFIGLIETAERVSGRRDSGSAYPKKVLKSSR